MPVRRNTYRRDRRKPNRLILVVSLAVVACLLVIWGPDLFRPSRDEEPLPDSLSQPGSRAPRDKGSLWAGPILHYSSNPDSPPMHLILVEKDLQKLSLYRYDGSYILEKTYRCVTGKQRGDKERENDDKTPEGIYFNNKTFRDSKITIFGDRAFGLSYPDAFDDLDGRRGSGIFIHGTNRDLADFSTNGCLVLDNSDLADLDRRIRFTGTPVIIGKRLPYRFGRPQRNLSGVLPILRKAMAPKTLAAEAGRFERLVVLSYRDQLVAAGTIRGGEPDKPLGTARAYLADAGGNLLMLIKQEWRPDERYLAREASKPAPPPSAEKRILALVESWRLAWQQERLEDYISHYHPSFVNKGRRVAEWKQYKGRLNRRYRRITVAISGIKVEVTRTSASAYFRQHYQTESYQADGYKRLAFRMTGGEWKIYREQSYDRRPPNWPS